MLNKFKKNNKQNSITDPIYKNIIIDENIKLVLDTKVFQRLKRIKQTGSVETVYPNSTHTRFAHSLGVYHLTKLLFIINQNFEKLPCNDKEDLFYACLLHDVGHGPYSHFFERITKINHEHFTKRIILENDELNKILRKIRKNLPENICSVIDHKHKNPIINSLLSSNIDLDRMDYIMRDAYFCGIQIGNIDYYWILSNINFKNQQVYFKSNTISAIENFLLNRYYMYKRVYLHPTVISRDMQILKIIERIRELIKNHDYKFQNIIKNNVFLKIIFNKDINLNDYLLLDDNSLNVFIMNLQNENDIVLGNLVQNFLKRKLYKYFLVSSKTKSLENKIKKNLNNKNDWNRNYNFFHYKLDLIPIKKYDFDNFPIFVNDLKTNKIIKIELISKITSGIINELQNFKNDPTIYFYYLDD